MHYYALFFVISFFFSLHDDYVLVKIFCIGCITFEWINVSCFLTFSKSRLLSQCIFRLLQSERILGMRHVLKYECSILTSISVLDSFHITFCWHNAQHFPDSPALMIDSDRLTLSYQPSTETLLLQSEFTSVFHLDPTYITDMLRQTEASIPGEPSLISPIWASVMKGDQEFASRAPVLLKTRHAFIWCLLFIFFWSSFDLTLH